jgi:hypothetical protein
LLVDEQHSVGLQEEQQHTHSPNNVLPASQDSMLGLQHIQNDEDVVCKVLTCLYADVTEPHSQALFCQLLGEYVWDVPSKINTDLQARDSIRMKCPGIHQPLDRQGMALQLIQHVKSEQRMCFSLGWWRTSDRSFAHMQVLEEESTKQLRKHYTRLYP